MTKITALRVEDVRFPTSLSLDGSDAMNPDPDYSAAYVVLETDHPSGLEGHGLTFTTGRGTELCVAAAKLRSFEGIVTKSTDWRTLNTAAEELAQTQTHASAEGREHAAD